MSAHRRIEETWRKSSSVQWVDRNWTTRSLSLWFYLPEK